MTDPLAILRREFGSEDGSFLLGLRCHAEWDRKAFSTLVLAMERCAAQLAGRTSIDRWIAEGFWLTEWFVRDWTSRPDCRRPHDEAYHEAASGRLHDLAYWLFTGESPYEGKGPLPPL